MLRRGSKGKLAETRSASEIFVIEEPSAAASGDEGEGVVAVVVGPGNVPLVLEGIGSSAGARVKAVLEGSDLEGEVDVGWTLLSVNGIDVTAVGADAAGDVLKRRSGERRKLRFDARSGSSARRLPVEVALERSAILNLGLTFDPAAAPPLVTAVAPSSPLAGRVAVGAALVSLESLDLSGLSGAEVGAVLARAAAKSASKAFALKFQTPRPTAVRLACLAFKGEAPGEAAAAARASAWLGAADLEVLSVETTAGGGLRVWYNALAPKNLRPAVLAAVAARGGGAETLSDDDDENVESHP